jgi:hypothetical protein
MLIDVFGMDDPDASLLDPWMSVWKERGRIRWLVLSGIAHGHIAARGKFRMIGILDRDTFLSYLRKEITAVSRRRSGC